jgi:hypothetical protein
VISAKPDRLPAGLIVRDQLKPDDGDGKQGERDDKRGKRVREVKAIGARIETGQEAGKAAGGREPVNQRDANENDADNADNPWHWLGHGKRLTEARASGKRQLSSVAFGCTGTQPAPVRAAQRAAGDRKSATRAGDVDEASALTAS